jgi:hypothetical protein
MKIIANWIIESLAAAVVIIVCVGIPAALKLPAWTLALAAFPIVFYLSWRLDGRTPAWRRVVVFAAILSALLLVQELLVPQSWHSWSQLVIVVIAAWVGPAMLPKTLGRSATP